MDSVVKKLKIYFILLNNPSLLKAIITLLYKYANIFVIGFERIHLIITHNRQQTIVSEVANVATAL